MTRLWEQGKPLQVLNENEIPVSIQWSKTWHPIQHIALFWQIDVNWWQMRIYRDYYKVLTADGLLLVIYHNLLDDSWVLQRVYD